MAKGRKKKGGKKKQPKWGKIGAPGSQKRKDWMKEIRRQKK